MTADTNDIIVLIREGDKVGLKVYLRNGGDVNARNQMGWTLLHIACLEGQAEIAEILLDAGATINCCTTDMCTPLHRACSGGNEAAVKVLLDKGAYINAQDKNGNTPLHEAARGLYTSAVNLLLQKKADKSRVNKRNQIFTDLVGQQLMPIVESGDIDTLIPWLDWGLSANTFGNLNWSLLHHASAMGQINIASVLLERGADVNAIDSNRSSPLHGASFHGHKRIVELLIGRKANVNVQDQKGNTPLHSAILGGHPDIINLLLDSGSDVTIPNKEGQIFTHLVNEFLKDAIDKNRVAHVIALLKGKANPNTTDAAGTPVLCCASFKGDILMVDALLEACADPNLCSADSQKSPLHYAASAGHFFVLKSLLDKNASVHLKDRNGSTALHEAAREGAEDVITVLTGRGSALNAQDNDGNSPLHIAARWGQIAAVELLIEKGAAEDIRNKSGLLYSDLALMRAVRTEDASHVLSGLAWGGNPDVQDEKGWTLLHHAAYKGALEVCSVLIESGANVDILDKHGRTPLLLAAYRGNQEIMEILLNSRANMNAQDNNGQTPLHWAADEGSIGAVELLLQRGADRLLRNKNGCLYSDHLLKHLYFAVRHNDSQKVECLLKAGADQTAVLRGTGTTPRDEAKRRKLYPILKKMVAMAPKKKIPPLSKEASVAIEDVSKLFENRDDQSQSSSEESGNEEEWDPDEDAYWKMHNAPIILKAKDIFQEEENSFWQNWDEKPKVISAKEFFKEEQPWWLNKGSSSDSESSSDESESEKVPTFEELKQDWGNVISAKEFFRDDECWWRDAVEEIEDNFKPKIVSAKEIFKEDTSWWENESEDEEKQEKWVPAKDFFKDDTPWWNTENYVDEIDDSMSLELEDNAVSDVEMKKTNEALDDEDIDESLTDDWDTANESVISETSTMFSASEGEKVTAAEVFAEQPWWDLDNDDFTEDIEIFNADSLGKDISENISDNTELTKVADLSYDRGKHPVIRRIRKSSLTESESSATLLDSYGSNEALNDGNYLSDEIFEINDLKSIEMEVLAVDDNFAEQELTTINLTGAQEKHLRFEELNKLHSISNNTIDVTTDSDSKIIVTKSEIAYNEQEKDDALSYAKEIPDSFVTTRNPSITEDVNMSAVLINEEGGNNLGTEANIIEFTDAERIRSDNMIPNVEFISSDDIATATFDEMSENKNSEINRDIPCKTTEQYVRNVVSIREFETISRQVKDMHENLHLKTHPTRIEDKNALIDAELEVHESLGSDKIFKKTMTKLPFSLPSSLDESSINITFQKQITNQPNRKEIDNIISAPDVNKVSDATIPATTFGREAKEFEFPKYDVIWKNVENLNQNVALDENKYLEIQPDLGSFKNRWNPHKTSAKIATETHVTIPSNRDECYPNVPDKQIVKQSGRNDHGDLIFGKEADTISDNKQQKYLKYRDEKHVSITKPVINKMDACLAKVDATLAWLDARMANDSPSDSNNICPISDITYSPHENIHASRTSHRAQKDKESKAGSELAREKNVNIFKINVRIPEDSGSKSENIILNCPNIGLGQAIKHHSLLKSQSSLDDMVDNCLPDHTSDKLINDFIISEKKHVDSTSHEESKKALNVIDTSVRSSDGVIEEKQVIPDETISILEETLYKLQPNKIFSSPTLEINLLNPHCELLDRVNSIQTEENIIVSSNSNEGKAFKHVKIPDQVCEVNITECLNNEQVNPKTVENVEIPKLSEKTVTLETAVPISAKLQVVLKSGTQIISSNPYPKNVDSLTTVIKPPRKRSSASSQNISLESQKVNEVDAKVIVGNGTTTITKHILERDLPINNTHSDTNDMVMPPTAPQRKRDLHRNPSVTPRKKDITLIDSLNQTNYRKNVLSNSDPTEIKPIEEVCQQHLHNQLTDEREQVAALNSTTTIETRK